MASPPHSDAIAWCSQRISCSTCSRTQAIRKAIVSLAASIPDRTTPPASCRERTNPPCSKARVLAANKLILCASVSGIGVPTHVIPERFTMTTVRKVMKDQKVAHPRILDIAQPVELVGESLINRPASLRRRHESQQIGRPPPESERCSSTPTAPGIRSRARLRHSFVPPRSNASTGLETQQPRLAQRGAIKLAEQGIARLFIADETTRENISIAGSML